MVALSSADHRHSPPQIRFPAEYNAADDLLGRNLQAGRSHKVAYIDDHGSYTYREVIERVNRLAHALIGLGPRPAGRVLVCLHATIEFSTAVLRSIQARRAS